ncbi:MAG: hypothetical protein AB7K24_04305 [Gemmataceae bacterium]
MTTSPFFGKNAAARPACGEKVYANRRAAARLTVSPIWGKTSDCNVAVRQ